MFPARNQKAVLSDQAAMYRQRPAERLEHISATLRTQVQPQGMERVSVCQHHANHVLKNLWETQVRVASAAVARTPVTLPAQLEYKNKP